MNIVSNQPGMNTCYNRQSAPNFKGSIGEKFTSELVNKKDVNVADVMEAVKGTFGPSSEKVRDVLEELKSTATRLIHSDKNVDWRIAESEKKIAETTAKHTQIAEKTTKETTQHIEEGLKAQEAKIAEQEKEITGLNDFSSQYKDLTAIKYDSAKLLSPQETMETMRAMSEGAKGAYDDMFNFLMTGKGGDKAVKYANQGTELWRAYGDRVFDIPDVKKVQEECKGIKINGPENTLIDLMKTSLIVNPKGSYIAAPPIKAQVKTNAKAILSPLYKSPELLERDLGRMFEEVEKTQKDFSNAKKAIAKKHPECSYTYEPNNYYDAKVTEFIDGKENNSWSYGNFAYYFNRFQ